MLMINWNELKKGKWIVAVSGGADSMALLDMCQQHGINMIAAHVNYQKRDTADRDMNGVKAYCASYQVPCFIHIVEHYDKQNFQAQARAIRYRFFAQLCDEQKADGVLVAHHFDDVIETYLMQKQRKSIPSWYGIAEETYLYGILIKRILLSYSKQELKEYCQFHQVVYYDDESNFKDDYTRNKIRHQCIENMSAKEKEQYQKEIVLENEKLKQLNDKIKVIVDHLGTEIEVEAFKLIDRSLSKYVLREWILRNTALYEVRERNLNELIDMIFHKNKNFRHNINEYYYILVEYGMLSIYENGDEDYCYVYDKPVYEKTPYFSIAKEGKKIEGITLSAQDYPITIRNAAKGDKIQLRMGRKKVSRFFIDNKISHKERKIWPVVVNSKGNVIYVHKIGCDIEHYSNNSTIFVLK